MNKYKAINKICKKLKNKMLKEGIKFSFLKIKSSKDKMNELNELREQFLKDMVSLLSLQIILQKDLEKVSIGNLGELKNRIGKTEIDIKEFFDNCSKTSRLSYYLINEYIEMLNKIKEKEKDPFIDETSKELEKDKLYQECINTYTNVCNEAKRDDFIPTINLTEERINQIDDMANMVYNLLVAPSVTNDELNTDDLAKEIYTNFGAKK